MKECKTLVGLTDADGNPICVNDIPSCRKIYSIETGPEGRCMTVAETTAYAAEMKKKFTKDYSDYFNDAVEILPEIFGLILLISITLFLKKYLKKKIDKEKDKNSKIRDFI